MRTGNPFPHIFWKMAKRENVIPYEPTGKLIIQAGAERVSDSAKVALAEYLNEYAMEIGKLAAKYASHAGRATVTESDISLAVKNLESH